MYPCYHDGIEFARREKYPVLWIAGENLLHLSSWSAAGWLLWPLRCAGLPLATMAWAVMVVVIQILLKKHNCSGCYYFGKSCHLGWGKLSSWLFTQDSGDAKTGLRLSLFYILSPPLVLLAAVLAGILTDVGKWHWIALGAYVALNAVTFPVRIVGCGSCAMRKVCPGSAVKGRAPLSADNLEKNP